MPPTPSPRITSRAAEHTNHRFNEPEQPRRRKPSPDHRLRINDPARKKSPRRHPTEALTIVEGYRSAAARERQAFGIPPSDSDEILEKAADGYADTRSSDRTMWQDDKHDELSEDAESILKMLEYEDTRRYKGKQVRLYYCIKHIMTTHSQSGTRVARTGKYPPTQRYIPFTIWFIRLRRAPAPNPVEPTQCGRTIYRSAGLEGKGRGLSD